MRRPQFSLRALLLLATLIGVAFGAAHLVKRYGEFVEVPSHKAGDAVMLEGRLIRLFGPKTIRLKVLVYDPRGDVGFMFERPSSRTWMCAYPFSIDFDLGGRSPPAGDRSVDPGLWEYVPPEPGAYVVTLQLINGTDESSPTCRFLISP